MEQFKSCRGGGGTPCSRTTGSGVGPATAAPPSEPAPRVPAARGGRSPSWSLGFLLRGTQAVPSHSAAVVGSLAQGRGGHCGLSWDQLARRCSAQVERPGSGGDRLGKSSEEMGPCGPPCVLCNHYPRPGGPGPCNQDRSILTPNPYSCAGRSLHKSRGSRAPRACGRAELGRAFWGQIILSQGQLSLWARGRPAGAPALPPGNSDRGQPSRPYVPTCSVRDSRGSGPRPVATRGHCGLIPGPA